MSTKGVLIRKLPFRSSAAFGTPRHQAARVSSTFPTTVASSSAAYNGRNRRNKTRTSLRLITCGFQLSCSFRIIVRCEISRHRSFGTSRALCRLARATAWAQRDVHLAHATSGRFGKVRHLAQGRVRIACPYFQARPGDSCGGTHERRTLRDRT